MKYTRENIIDILLKSYVAYYNITDFGTEREPLRALCEYYEHAEKYMVSRKVSLWAADSEEFIYLLMCRILRWRSLKLVRKQLMRMA